MQPFTFSQLVWPPLMLSKRDAISLSLPLPLSSLHSLFVFSSLSPLSFTHTHTLFLSFFFSLSLSFRPFCSTLFTNSTVLPFARFLIKYFSALLTLLSLPLPNCHLAFVFNFSISLSPSLSLSLFWSPSISLSLFETFSVILPQWLRREQLAHTVAMSATRTPSPDRDPVQYLL